MRPLLLALAATILALACHSPYQRCKPEHLFGGPYDQALPSRTYEVAPTVRTAKGIAVDTSGQAFDLVALDALTDEVEACLARTFPGGALPDAVWHGGSCEAHSFPPVVNRQCLTVKVASDWFQGISGYQLLPHGNGGSCEEKGHGSGKCFYRVSIQDHLTIVTPPKLGLYAEAVIKVATGCHALWGSPPLAACAISHEQIEAPIARSQ